MIYILAYITDLVIGDPFKFHPIIIVGNTIKRIEKVVYKNNYLNGLLLLVISLVIFITPIYLLRFIVSDIVIGFISYYLIYALIATKSLYKETNKVNQALTENRLEDARILLSYVVSRETSKLNEQQIKKALIETISENTIDGVIAPLFYLFLGVLFNHDIELMIGYKIVNTLDSMVGYKNKRYNKFGFFSAKADDILNYIPARIGSLFMLVPGFIYSKDFKKTLSIFFKNRNNQSSPNAGYPEAAIAGILDIKLAGPSYYFGNIVSKKYIGSNDKEITNNDIKTTYKVLFFSSTLFMLFMIGVLYGI
ncbi:cobalamin biosynthesis protein CobD [Candidatus Izimaplasma bacterium ZiA1]|uniref:adenosylcobinamide-phosphate synthase CbiB n=1 Tax=Candidatus Izimoplasma sp. ZiA1 TaxID=2024899 RepID=UPI000BAA517A|nr:cobalamin biosynthesis protein CobD [Candidatus Izimaplasma bacterium ZiA1]